MVLTRGGSTARLVAKYRPSIPVLTVAVPVLTTDSLTWTCSGEAPARQCLITRGLLPLLAEGSARATDTDTTDEILQVSIGALLAVMTLRLLSGSDMRIEHCMLCCAVLLVSLWTASVARSMLGLMLCNTCCGCLASLLHAA